MRKYVSYFFGLLWLITIFVFVVLTEVSNAKQSNNIKYSEKMYQTKWCDDHKGKLEVKVPDVDGKGFTKCDCVTKDFAIEVEFAHKWYDSVGQSLYYALMLDKKPMIVLILEKESDWKFYSRLEVVAKKYNIELDLLDSSFFNEN